MKSLTHRGMINLEDQVPGLVHNNCIELSEDKGVAYVTGDLLPGSPSITSPVIIIDIRKGEIIGNIFLNQRYDENFQPHLDHRPQKIFHRKEKCTWNQWRLYPTSIA